MILNTTFKKANNYMDFGQGTLMDEFLLGFKLKFNLNN